jgi:hypothetical protein
MGYTHYWRRPRYNSGSAYMFGQLALDAKKIIKQAEQNGVRIRNGNGVDEPEFSEFYFSINGDAVASTANDQDLAYETFYWEGIPTIQKWRKDEPTTFDFCKTAYKPYDAVVTAILIRAKHIYGSCVEISSDGEWDCDNNFPDGYGSWVKGRELYEQVFGEIAECPFERISA